MSAPREAAGWPLHARPHATICTREGSHSPSPVLPSVPASSRCSPQVCLHERSPALALAFSRARRACEHAARTAACVRKVVFLVVRENDPFFSKGCSTRQTHTSAGPPKTHDGAARRSDETVLRCARACLPLPFLAAGGLASRLLAPAAAGVGSAFATHLALTAVGNAAASGAALPAAAQAVARVAVTMWSVVSTACGGRPQLRSSWQSHAERQNVREERAVEPSVAIVDACAAAAGVRACVSKTAHACALARTRVQERGTERAAQTARRTPTEWVVRPERAAGRAGVARE